MDQIEHGRRIHRDTAATVLLGPIRLLLIMVGTLFLLRVVLERAGLEVVGLWSLLNLAAAFISLIDIGFSSCLTRDFHVLNNSAQTTEHLLNQRAVERFYLLFSSFVILPTLMALMWLPLSIHYDKTRFVIALGIMAVSALSQLRGKLEAALLAAYQDNVRIQIVNTVGMVIFLSIAITGAYLNAPLECAAFGSLLSAEWIRWRLHQRATAHYPKEPIPKMGMKEDLRRVLRMAQAGIHFYSLSLGSILREPCLRLIITTLLGAKALGAYTIGFRLSAATRDIVAGGFSVLYPSMASLHRAGRHENIAALQTASMVILLTLGSLALGLLYAFVEPLFMLLLGSIPEGVVSATRILVLWNLITLFNVPFDYLLQAAGHERISAASLWAHTLAILLLWPLSLFVHLNMAELLGYWTLSSLATQFVIYYSVQKRLKGFWPVVKNRAVVIILSLTLIYWIVVLGWTFLVQAPAGSWGQALKLTEVLIPASLGFLGLAFLASRKFLVPFWRARQ
jgi:O-antigen/teichoic acid export membrane protein